jgi:hypothetical protein
MRHPSLEALQCVSINHDAARRSLQGGFIFLNYDINLGLLSSKSEIGLVKSLAFRKKYSSKNAIRLEIVALEIVAVGFCFVNVVAIQTR